jgi:molybdopterin/thiamine biosynthesis adenylyltransferase/rhodanese-related sulfurtransferase
MTLSDHERARYSRHLLLGEIGQRGQQQLKAARVLIVGAGGLGSPAALYLAAAGIGTLGIIDGDRVDLSNLQRQVLFDVESLGRPKAEVAREKLQRLNPEIDVRAHAVELRAGNVREILGDYDIVLDGSDRLGTRYLVNDACVIYGKSLVSAAIHRFEGQAMTYVPGLGPCYRCLFSDSADGVVPNCAEAGVLGVLPGVMGTVQATEAIKLITGIGEPLTGRLLTYDALDMRFNEFRFRRRADCAVCGERPTITVPRDVAELCAADIPGLRQFSPQELRAFIDQSAAPALQLIDVRDPHEFVTGHIAGAINIPLGDLARRIREVQNAAPPVFVCLTGVRSLRACAIARDAGLTASGHLAGGMRAWDALQAP